MKIRLKKTKLAWRIFKESWHIRPTAILGFFVGVALEVGGFILSIYATAQLAGLLAQYVTGGDTSGVWFWLWVDVGAAASVAIGFWVMSWMKRLLYFRTTVWATTQFQAALCRMDIQDFYDEKIRNQINKAQSGYVWQISGLNESVLDLTYAIIRFLVTAVVVAQITWWLIPLIALFLLPTMLVNARMAKVKWFVWDEKGDDRHIFWGMDWLIRQAKNQMELRSSQAQKYILSRIRDMNARFYQKQETEAAKPNRLMPPAALMEVAGTATGSIIALQQFLAGVISLDRYFFVSGALLRIGGSINNIFGTIARMQEPLLLAQDFFAIIDREPKYVDVANPITLTGAGPPEIVFEHVKFTYPGQEKPVFQDLSFRIAPGEHVAIVGENGAGKSTLIKLLLRFYKPDSGRILIDGHDLREVAIESWYARLATLFQTFNQYPLSIRENIEIARPEYKGDVKRLLEAAQFSNVNHFVHEYKHGWETVLDNSFEKGVEPSGGQWQRVALARAFYRSASVLILDEPTAAIDAKAEYDIFNNIFAHYQNKTAIIVSHRFSTVRRAHTIIVVEHGKIMERGSHEELMKKPKGLYRDMFSKQAEGYQ
jgi:ATP-binding cassette, subfamily B, bacterial